MKIYIEKGLKCSWEAANSKGAWCPYFAWGSQGQVVLYRSVKGIVHAKMKINSSFTHHGVILMLHAHLSVIDHKRRIKNRACARPYNGSE